MLWSLIKILIFFAVIAVLAWGGGYLIEARGGAIVQFGGMEYSLSPIQVVVGLGILLMAVWLLLKLASLTVATLRFVSGDETAISRYFDRNRERKGLKALSDSLTALASGEASQAMTHAARARRFLDRPDLTNLITAQAADLSGDRQQAEDAYKKLIQDSATRFVGVRGVMKQRLVEGDTETALKLAEKAFALKPRHEETQDTLLQLQTGAQDWAGARKTLSAKLKHGTLPRDVHRRREAVLALSEARDLIGDDEDSDRQETAIEANRLSPDLIPAAVLAARGYIEQSKPKYAVRVLKKAWDAQPHPDLARAFAEIKPDETPEERRKRFKALIKGTEDHAETRLLLAELALAAQDFPEARRAVGDLHEADPDARVLTLMAAIEKGEGAPDDLVKGWLARALSAPRSPQWVCDNCHNIQGDWAPTCSNCGALDTLTWTRPPAAEVSSPTGIAMLPLIVGAIEDQSDDTAEDADLINPDDEAQIILPSPEESASIDEVETVREG